MIGWLNKKYQRERLDRQRRQRLHEKAMRLHVVDALPDVIATARTWNKRRGMVSQISVERKAVR